MVTKPFKIVYAPDVKAHLIAIPHKHYSLVQRNIVEQLSYEPKIKTANRKPLQFSRKYGEWELRFGPENRYRIIYRFSLDQ
jgi:hypothetical protein